MQVIFILSLAIALLMVIFTLQNAEPIDVKFLFWNIRGSLALVLLLSFIAGVVTSFMLSLSSAMKKNKQKQEAADKTVKKTQTPLPEESPKEKNTL
jgi:uncharacterized integral membrane protein